MRGHVVVLVLALAVAASCAPPASPTSGALSGTVVDLSHEYSDQAIFWPTAEGFRLDKVADGMTPQGYYYAANNFAGAEHGGTHIDAPVHFAQGRWSVEQIPLEQLIGDAAVIDVSAQERDAAGLPGHGRRSHGMGTGARIAQRRPSCCIRTGLLEALARRRALPRHGGARRGGGGQAAFPGLHPDAARWLVANAA